MPMMLQGGPFKAPVAGFHRFTVKQYHKMIADGVLTEDDRVELLEGYLVDKMPHDPIHDGTIQKINRRLVRAIPAGWEVRVQSAVTLSQSEPEPDLALVREDRNGFMNRHPGISDFGILIEVSNSTLDTDRAAGGVERLPDELIAGPRRSGRVAWRQGPTRSDKVRQGPTRSDNHEGATPQGVTPSWLSGTARQGLHRSETGGELRGCRQPSREPTSCSLPGLHE